MLLVNCTCTCLHLVCAVYWNEAIMCFASLYVSCCLFRDVGRLGTHFSTSQISVFYMLTHRWPTWSSIILRKETLSLWSFFLAHVNSITCGPLGDAGRVHFVMWFCLMLQVWVLRWGVQKRMGTQRGGRQVGVGPRMHLLHHHVTWEPAWLECGFFHLHGELVANVVM